MRKTEVTNLEYRTFLNDLIIQKRFGEYKLAKPDDSLWEKMYGKGLDSMKIYSPNGNGMNDIMKIYTTHPAYNNYPITNISRKGAELYIQWLNSEIPPKEKDIILTDYRIPTRLEWVYAASSQGKQFPYPWNGEFMRDSKGLYLANYKPFPQRFADDGGFSSVKVDSYHPNQLGLYNMSGNVAEMVDNMEFKEIDGKKIWTKVGIGTAGGGWLESADDIKILAKDNYDGIELGHPNIGFRYVKTFRLKTK
jgi:formylglycine-generating enzyme required for sulfatase activity